MAPAGSAGARAAGRGSLGGETGRLPERRAQRLCASCAVSGEPARGWSRRSASRRLASEPDRRSAHGTRRPSRSCVGVRLGLAPRLLAPGRCGAPRRTSASQRRLGPVSRVGAAPTPCNAALCDRAARRPRGSRALARARQRRLAAFAGADAPADVRQSEREQQGDEDAPLDADGRGDALGALQARLVEQPVEDQHRRPAAGDRDDRAVAAGQLEVASLGAREQHRQHAGADEQHGRLDERERLEGAEARLLGAPRLSVAPSTTVLLYHGSSIDTNSPIAVSAAQRCSRASTRHASATRSHRPPALRQHRL